MNRMTCRAIAAVCVCVLTPGLAACGDSREGTSGTGTTRPETGGFAAQVASYELVANQDQRFLAGLAGSGSGTVVSFGALDFEFFWLGTEDRPVDPPERKSSARATFLPVPGEDADPNQSGPREVRPSEGVGVYQAGPVRFDNAGFWGVTVSGTVDARSVTANASFEVLAQPRAPFPGQAAPRTDNPMGGAPGVDPVAIDSRASSGAPIPDPALHSTSVAAALAAGRPVVVVVSTPVYCVSRFCGPVTDTVERLAGTYADRVSFVHLEVWGDFQNKVINPWAAEWIQPGGTGDAQEPWVFLVGGDGTVRERFDNVVGDAALEAAVKELAG